MKEIQIQWCVIPANVYEIKYNLHTFADASKEAYCATVYLVCKLQNQVSSNIIAAKTRLPPLRKVRRIPKLELTAARIAAKLTVTVKEALLNTPIEECSMLTDSSTVLHWIEGKGKYKQFVENRVKEIHSLLPNVTCKHCLTQDNPADLGTRGKILKQLQSLEKWWHGPSWLCTDWWPQQLMINQTEEARVEELKPAMQVFSTSKEGKGLSGIVDLRRFSSKEKLLKVTACSFRFIKFCQQGKKDFSKNLEVSEILKAETEWIKEIRKTMQNEKNFDQTKRALNVIKINEILRCEGRLGNARVPFETKKPILLSARCLFTELVIMDSHKRIMHGWVNSTLAEIRERYWIPKGRQVVKQVLRKCNKCAKDKVKPLGAPETGQLPKERLEPSRPFPSIGVDFTGAIQMQNGGKAYVVLFTCGITRAIHLELVEDMTALQFVSMLQRFIASRGAPSLIKGDNAKTFLATARHLKKIIAKEPLESFLIKNRIKWGFITPKAPWQGEFYERLIGFTKNTLYKSMGCSKIRFRELETMIIQIKRVLNNRPLVYQAEDQEDEVITPNYLIYGQSLPIIENSDEDNK